MTHKIDDAPRAAQRVVLAVLPDEQPILGISHENFLGRMPSIGILYLAAALEKQGYDVATFDGQSDPAILPDLVQRITAEIPSLVGFTVFDATLAATRDVILALRKDYSGPVVVGGYTPTFHAAEILAEYPEIDYVVVREGEAAICGLMEYLNGRREIETVPNLVYRSEAAIQRNPEGPLADVTALPWPRRQWPERGDVTPIISRRGCLSRCSFCSMVPFYDLRFGPIVRTREPVEVVDEIAYCVDRGSQEFMFYDDDFNLSTPATRRWCEQFAAEVKRRSLRFHWGVELRVPDVVRGAALLKDLCDVGLTHLSIGMESMLPRQLKLYNKGYQQSDVYEAIAVARGLPADFQTNVIFWDPWISLDETVEHVRLLDSIAIQEQLGSVNAPFCSVILIPRRGTKVFEAIEAAGIMRQKAGTFHLFEWDFVDPEIRAFMQRTYLRFLLKFRRIPRPPALWLVIPRMEHEGKQEAADDLRRQAGVVAALEFGYFSHLLREAQSHRTTDPHGMDRATVWVHKEWSARLDAEAQKLLDLWNRNSLRRGQPGPAMERHAG